MCEIVKDLLAKYITNDLSKESRELIEEHMDTCRECKEELSFMMEEIEVEDIKEIKINYFKKIKTILRNTLILLTMMSLISFVLGIYIEERNNSEAVFTIILWIIVFITVFIKYVIPLLILAVGIVSVIRFKNICIRGIAIVSILISGSFIVRFLKT